MARKMTRRKAWIPMPPRGLRPKLAAGQVVDLDLCHLGNLDAIARGEADETVLWQYAGGCYTWSKVAELLGVGIPEMADEVSVVVAVIDRYHRTGRVEFDGTEYERAKVGVDVMCELARIVDRPTAIVAVVKASTPSTAQLAAVVQALAQVFADSISVDCKLVLRIPDGIVNNPGWQDVDLWGSETKEPAP